MSEQKQQEKSVTFRLDSDTHKAAKIRAMNLDTTLKDYVIGLINADLRKNKEENE